MVGLSLKGQQLPMFSGSFLNPILYNPAVPGSSNQNQASLLVRNQWKEFKGPQINCFSADFLLRSKPVGLGALVYTEKVGIQEILKAKLAYSYSLQIGDHSKLMMGLAAGITNQKLNFAALTPERSDDPVLLSGSERALTPDFDAGVTFKGKSYAIGACVSQAQGSLFSKTQSYTPSRTATILGNYQIALTEDTIFRVVPFAALRIVQGSPLHYDAGVAGAWKNILWLGGSYKNGYAASLTAAVQMFNMRVGFSYEIPVNSIKRYLPPATEFSLAYVIPNYQQSKPKTKKSVITDKKEPRPDKGKKTDEKAAKKQELQMLFEELDERETQLRKHERQIYDLIDSLYTRAGQQQGKSNEEEFDKVTRTQQEVNRIKEELKNYTKEKNVELFRLRRRIEELQKEINEME